MIEVDRLQVIRSVELSQGAFISTNKRGRVSDSLQCDEIYIHNGAAHSMHNKRDQE